MEEREEEYIFFTFIQMHDSFFPQDLVVQKLIGL